MSAPAAASPPRRWWSGARPIDRCLTRFYPNKSVPACRSLPLLGGFGGPEFFMRFSEALPLHTLF